jgi:hypothetical protein
MNVYFDYYYCIDCTVIVIIIFFCLARGREIYLSQSMSPSSLEGTRAMDGGWRREEETKQAYE